MAKNQSYLARFYVKYLRAGVKFGEREFVPPFRVFQCLSYCLVISWFLRYSRRHVSSAWSSGFMFGARRDHIARAAQAASLDVKR